VAPPWNLLSDGEGTVLECKWRGKTANNAAMEMPQLVVERLLDELFACDRKLRGHTELFIQDDRDGAPRLLRCHPFYRGKPWYDWCMVNYQLPGDRPFPSQSAISGKYVGCSPPSYFPAKLLAVVGNPFYDSSQPESPADNPKVQWVIHSTQKLVK
jgi:hypothetical protein